MRTNDAIACSDRPAHYRFLPVTMRLRYPALLLTMVGAMHTAVAQDRDNGKRITERWCSECHALTPVASGKRASVPSFAAIAAQQGITSDMIASFLLMPHATMPAFSLSRNEAQDIAAFIVSMKPSR